MRSRKDLFIAMYKAFNAREIDTVLANLHSNVDWPNGMEGGRVHGRSQVREYWQRQWAMVDPRVEPVDFEEDETGRIVVDVHQVVRDLAGKILLDQRIQHIYTFSGELIERMDIHELGPHR